MNRAPVFKRKVLSKSYQLLQLTSKMGKGAGGVEANWSLDSIREDAGKNSLAQGAVIDGFL